MYKYSISKSNNRSNVLGLTAFSPLDELLNEDLISKAIFECLKNNDPEGVVEVLGYYFSALESARSLKVKHGLQMSAQHNIRGKNPTIKTLAKVVHDNAVAVQKK